MLLTLLTACGGGSTGTLDAPAFAGTSEGATALREHEPASSRGNIRGLTGTLNADQVHQTMEERQDVLFACVQRMRQRTPWVGGSIDFAFRVGADGAVESVRATRSDVGHQELETCLTEVVAETRFPRPAGRASAEFSWGMSVESAYGSPPEQLDPSELERFFRERIPEVFEACEMRRYRNRFFVTAYLNRRGRVLSAGVRPSRARAAEHVDCVLETVRDWRFPRQKGRRKVSFVLK